MDKWTLSHVINTLTHIHVFTHFSTSATKAVEVGRLKPTGYRRQGSVSFQISRAVCFHLCVYVCV